MTMWPSALPAVTEVTGFSPYRLDGDLLKLDFDAQITTHEVPDELYLRELYELDPHDDEQILDFVNRFGRLGHPTQLLRRSDAGNSITGHDRQVIRELGAEVPDFRELPWDDWWEEVENAPSANELGVVETAIYFSDGLQHMDEFRGWALAFRRLTRLYLDFEGGRSSDMEKVALVLTDLMSPFSPVLDVVSDEETADWSPFRDTYLAPRLENVLALQMFNHIAAKDSYHVCANETHGGLFVHQRGRAERGQHRKTGVKFCSKQCAQAQASRVNRRRKKAKNTEEA